jgi:GNAT superfamily N-acetyltransferase
MTGSLTAPLRVTLRDGRRATIRPIRPDDIARNAAFLDGLSPHSKHLLFLGGVARLSPSALARLCDLDQASDMAYVATTEGETGGERQIGVCRYAGGDSLQGAEISVAVADDWQHQGLGKQLLNRLIGYAHARGVLRLYSMDSATNEPMRRLARDMGFAEQRDPSDPHQVIYARALT